MWKWRWIKSHVSNEEQNEALERHMNILALKAWIQKYEGKHPIGLSTVGKPYHHIVYSFEEVLEYIENSVG